MPRYLFRWKSRPDIDLLEREIAGLRTELIKLRRKLSGKAGYASRLELLVRQRSETIDVLNGRLEQARAANARLDQECERLVEMVKLT